MKALGQFLSSVLCCACLLAFLLFGNLSIHHGSTVSEALKVHLALQISLPRIQPSHGPWPNRLAVVLQDAFFHAFGEPASVPKHTSSPKKLTFSSIVARFGSLITVGEWHTNELSSHYAGLKQEPAEINIDMNPSNKQKTN